MAVAMIVSALFSPFLYGLEFFLASTLSTQIAISVATVVVSTATILYYQRSLNQWYEDTTEFIIRLKNKFNSGGTRRVTFSASTRFGGESDQGGDNTDPGTILGELGKETNESSIISSTIAAKEGSEKSQQPLQSWMERQSVAMHRSHWVAKPGKIAPPGYHGYIANLGFRRASADNTPDIPVARDTNEKPVVGVDASSATEQRSKPTLDRRQSSPSFLCPPLIVQSVKSEDTPVLTQPQYGRKEVGSFAAKVAAEDDNRLTIEEFTTKDIENAGTVSMNIPPETDHQAEERREASQSITRMEESTVSHKLRFQAADNDTMEVETAITPSETNFQSQIRHIDYEENLSENVSETPVIGFYRPSGPSDKNLGTHEPAFYTSTGSHETGPIATEEESSGHSDLGGDKRQAEDDEDLEDMPQAMLIPIETEVREALLVESSSLSDNEPPQRANMQPVPLENESDSRTTDDRSSGQTDTDSLATDDIFDSDSELDESSKKSLTDSVFVEENVEKPIATLVPSIHDDQNDEKDKQIGEHTTSNTRASNWPSQSGLVVVCELVETETVATHPETTDPDPDSSISLTVDRGPIPRKDSFGLAPLPRIRSPQSKTELKAFTTPIAKICVEEVKSDTDSEVAGIMAKDNTAKAVTIAKKSMRPLKIDAVIKIENPGKDPDVTAIRQDSLGVPPIVVGEVSFPRPVTQRSIPLIPVPLHPTIVLHPGTDEESEAKSETHEIKVKRIGSLDVPQIAKGEDRFPPLASHSEIQKTNIEIPEIKIKLPPRKTLKRGRPKSLDIPNLNLSESCPPRQIRKSPEESSSSSGSAPTSPQSGAKKKQGSSILKRAGSVDKSGPKKSVTFSPIVIPCGGSPQEHIEPLAGIHRLKRDNDLDSCKAIRPKIIRNSSVDIPDTMHLKEQIGYKRDSDLRRNSGTRDQGKGEQNILAKLRNELSPVKKNIDLFSKVSSDSTEDTAKRKSAKERFLEAGGAKAVMSAFVTQDSTDRHSTSSGSGSASLEHSDGEGKDSPTDQPTTSTKTADDGGAKSRFLGSEEGFLRASRFFIDRVKGSVESDYSEPQSGQNSPSSTDGTDETSSSSEQQFEENEEGGLRKTTAKSRFFLSCNTTNTQGFSTDRHLAMWEPVSPTLPEVPEADETEEEVSPLKDESAQFSFFGRQEGRVIYTPSSAVHMFSSSVDRSHLYDDEPSTSNDDDIGSPGSSGVHSMEPDEPIAQRLLEVAEADETPDVNRHTEVTHATRGSDVTRSTDVTKGTVYHSVGGTSYAHHHCKVPIVLDNGSQFLKVGPSNEDKPGIEIHNVIEREKDDTARSRFVGLDAVRHCHMSPFDFPIRGGVIENWQDMEAIWHYVFDSKLGLTPQEHPLLLTEIASVSKSQREKTFEILFETFNVPSLYTTSQASSSLKATGTRTGLVLSSGSGITEVVPIFDGNILTNAITRLDLGGRSVTQHLAHLVEEETGHNITSSPGALEVFRELKEDQTFVSKDYAAEHPEANSTLPWECWLPDGSTVEVSRIHVQECAEPLFQPSLAGIFNQTGLPRLVVNSLEQCDASFLGAFSSSLVLSGGNTYLGGFSERLQTELALLGHDHIKVDARKDRDLLPWCGGAVLARELSECNTWVGLEEYLDRGPNIVHHRCL